MSDHSDPIMAMSEESQDAFVAAMLQGWKKAMDEADRLRAEVERLRAIEASARAYCDLTPDRVDSVPWLFAKLQAALAAEEEA